MKQYREKNKDKWQNISETATTTQWKETKNTTDTEIVDE